MSAASHTAATDRRPNVLWVCADQQRADTIHALGNYAIVTPTLDALCASGTAFTRAYCQSPVCTPSRASFLTGRYPSHVGVNRNGNRDFPADATLVTKRLADTGYRCGLVGKVHLTSPYTGAEKRADDGYSFFRYSSDPWQPVEHGNAYAAWLERQGLGLDDVFTPKPGGGFRGYREDVDPALHQTRWCADEAIGFIESDHDAPWLLSVNLFDPHPPFDAPARYREPYLRDPALPGPSFQPSDMARQERLSDVYFQSRPKPPDEAARESIAAYYGMVTLLDEQLGRILDALDRTGQREDTLVVFMSDHGEMLGDRGLFLKGCRFYEGLVKVPLVVSWPGVVREGAVRDDLVELTDVAPTIAELSRATLDEAQGRSLVPCLVDGARHGRAYVRCEYLDALAPELPDHPEQHEPSYGTMYLDGRYKLISYHLHATGELYDLAADPHEHEDLWEAPAAADVKARLLREAFDAAMQALNDGPPAEWPY